MASHSSSIHLSRSNLANNLCKGHLLMTFVSFHTLSVSHYGWDEHLRAAQFPSAGAVHPPCLWELAAVLCSGPAALASAWGSLLHSPWWAGAQLSLTALGFFLSAHTGRRQPQKHGWCSNKQFCQGSHTYCCLELLLTLQQRRGCWPICVGIQGSFYKIYEMSALSSTVISWYFSYFFCFASSKCNPNKMITQHVPPKAFYISPHGTGHKPNVSEECQHWKSSWLRMLIMQTPATFLCEPKLPNAFCRSSPLYCLKGWCDCIFTS